MMLSHWSLVVVCTLFGRWVCLLSKNTETQSGVPMSDVLLLQTIPSRNVFQKWFRFFFKEKNEVFCHSLLESFAHCFDALEFSWGIQLELVPDYFYNNLLITVNIVLEVVLPWNMCPWGIWREKKSQPSFCLPKQDSFFQFLSLVSSSLLI